MRTRPRPVEFLLRRFFLRFLVLTSLFVSPVLADGPDSNFLRIRYSPEGYPVALESSIAKYKARGFEVDLISAVHVAEKKYFQDLNEAFKKYDAVLYELIAADNLTIPPKDKRPENPVSQLQGIVKKLLALEFQLDEINYSAKNFIHADLSPDAFMAALAGRGDSVWSLLARLLLQDMAKSEEQNPAKDIQILLSLLLSSDAERPYTLRRHLADNFSKIDDVVAQMEGPSGSTIIADRNSKAMAVLRTQVKAGKKKLAIYYGAAHMPDMEKRLISEFGAAKAGTQWLVAWPLQSEKKG